MRFRPTVRLRLTLMYGGLFLVAGALLLTINYALVRRSIDSRPGAGVSAIRVLVPAPEAGVSGQAFSLPAPAGLVIDKPVTVEGKPVADVVRDLSNDLRHETLSDLLTRSAQTLGGMALASIALGWLVAGRVLRPLHRVTAAARHLSEENLHERIGLAGPDDELKELADTFDAMLDRLEGAFESQRRFVANASHELRTPLTVMRTEVDVTLADPEASPGELRHMAEVVRRATERCDALIDSLLALARSDRGLTLAEPLDLAGVAADALGQVAGEAAAAGVRVASDLEAAPVTGDAALLGRLVGNLVENGIRHNHRGGWVEVRTGRHGDDDVLLRVTNSGPVVPPEAVDGLFEPFRRLAPDRTRPVSDQGVGLGLSIVRSAAAAHGGRVTGRALPGGGLEMSVVLMRASASTGPADALAADLDAFCP